MTSVFSATPLATPPADQPPTIANVRTAGQDYADRWDWLRIGAFFWGAVLLLNFAARVILAFWLAFWQPFGQGGYSLDYLSPQSYDLLTGWVLAVAEVGLAALVLIVASVVRSRDFWGDQGPGRLRAALRLLGALGVLAAAGGFVLIFSESIALGQNTPLLSPDFLTGAWLRAGGIGWVLIGVANGFVLGVALAFVFRRLSRRTGLAWLAGLLGAALVAGCALGLSNELDTLLLRASLAATRALWPPPPIIIICLSSFEPDACDAFIGGQHFGGQVQAWLVAAVLPVLLALPLGALLGAPLAYPDRASRASGTGPAQTTATHGAASDARVPAGPRNAPEVAGGWPALGRIAGAFAAGVFVTAARLYTVLERDYLPQETYLLNFLSREAGMLLLIGVQLLPFGVLALIGALRLLRMPRELRPPIWASAALALVVVPDLVTALSARESLTLPDPLTPPNALTYGGLGFAWAISLGALLAVCWWPAARTGTRLATTALAGWLGFALPLVLLAGASAYQFATDPTRYDWTTCYDLGCAAGKFATWAITGAVETALAAVLIGLPYTLFGAWIGSWLLERGTLSRAGDAVA